MLIRLLTINILLIVGFSCQSASVKSTQDRIIESNSIKEKEEILPIITGAERMEEYLPLIKNKKVGLLVNHSSRIGERHLIDVLLDSGIQVQRIFAPEHGYRGKAEAGETIKDEKDPITGIEVISLYKSKDKKPSMDELKDIDIFIFDIQDVGVRFYTYTSSMHYAMDACAEAGVPFLVLDRPNPNGWYVDGPVMQEEFMSFVGMQKVPIVHGLTTAELAQMIVGEGWLHVDKSLDLRVVKCKNYTHSMRYSLPVRPSPNLPNDRSIDLYASLCLMEGTAMSIGRGTEIPFQVFGHPSLPDSLFSFTPLPNEGNSKPLLQDQKCFGYDCTQVDMRNSPFSLQPIIKAFQGYKGSQPFFNTYFERLSGYKEFREQISSGMTEEDIRKTWEPALSNYKELRKKYLLYPEGINVD